MNRKKERKGKETVDFLHFGVLGNRDASKCSLLYIPGDVRMIPGQMSSIQYVFEFEFIKCLIVWSLFFYFVPCFK